MNKFAWLTLVLALFWVPLSPANAWAQTSAVAMTNRTLSGVVVSPQQELVPQVTVRVRSASGEQQTVTDSEGNFRFEVPRGEALTLELSGKNIAPLTRNINSDEATESLRITIEYVVSPIHESIVIVASQFDPGIERRNDEVYQANLFSRDDQLFDTLAAGINAGQHENCDDRFLSSRNVAQFPKGFFERRPVLN